MIPVYIAVLLVAGVCVGWFAHRAYVRMVAWGRAMHAQNTTSETEIDGALRRVHVLQPSNDRFRRETASAK